LLVVSPSIDTSGSIDLVVRRMINTCSRLFK
jgi:hypothetical protein